MITSQPLSVLARNLIGSCCVLWAAQLAGCAVEAAPEEDSSRQYQEALSVEEATTSNDIDVPADPDESRERPDPLPWHPDGDRSERGPDPLPWQPDPLPWGPDPLPWRPATEPEQADPMQRALGAPEDTPSADVTQKVERAIDDR